MVAVPATTPVSNPELGSIVATEVLPLAHVPPDVASVSVVVAPPQTADDPNMAAGDVPTLTVAVDLHDALIV